MPNGIKVPIGKIAALVFFDFVLDMPYNKVSTLQVHFIK